MDGWIAPPASKHQQPYIGSSSSSSSSSSHCTHCEELSKQVQALISRVNSLESQVSRLTLASSSNAQQQQQGGDDTGGLGQQQVAALLRNLASQLEG